MSVLDQQVIKKRGNFLKKLDKKVIYSIVVIAILIFIFTPDSDEIENISQDSTIVNIENSDNFKITFFHKYRDMGKILTQKPQAATKKNVEKSGRKDVIKGAIKRGENISSAFLNNGISQSDVYKIVQALKKGGYKFRQTKPGERYEIFFDKLGKLTKALVIPTGQIYYKIYKKKGDYKVKKKEAKLKYEDITISGVVKSSIYNAVLDNGYSPKLVFMLADEVFKGGGRIDFVKDCRSGDRYSIKFSKEYYINYDGKKIYTGDYGDIEGVYYKGKITGDIYAFGFKNSKTGKLEYYDEKGEGIKGPFLKIPLTFRARVTSNYGNRKHPILGFNKKHLGIDFGVKVGTPFISVADGKVIKVVKYNSKSKRGAGNLVRVRHNNGYETEFFHLSKVKRKIKRGSYVKQGEVLGYSGNTGGSTGPHLHYGMRKICSKKTKGCLKRYGYRYGVKYIHPLKHKFKMKATPLSRKDKKRFMKKSSKIKETLDRYIIKNLASK